LPLGGLHLDTHGIHGLRLPLHNSGDRRNRTLEGTNVILRRGAVLRVMATANTASTSGLLNLEKELVCFICTEVLYQPLTLIDCLHTFCGSCLKEWFSYQHKKASHSRSSQTSSPYTCPTCRANVKDARHNATVSTLLDMFLTANPDRGRSEQEKEDMGKAYKPGEDILPKLDVSRRHDRRARRAEEAAEEAERRMVEEARERSLRETRGRGPEQSSGNLTAPDISHDSGRSNSRDSRDREARRERRRDQERQERRRRAEVAEAAYARESGEIPTEAHPGTSSSSLPPPSTSPRHPDAIEARRTREIGHQGSLRSLVSASDSGTGTGDSLTAARIMQEILSDGLLESIDLRDLDAAQEDELSERIAEAYRQRHQMRGQDSPRQISRTTSTEAQTVPSGANSSEPVQSAERRHRHHRSGSSQPTAAAEASQTRETAEARHPPVSRPHLLETSENLHPPTSSTAHRRRASDQNRRQTSPNSHNSRTASAHSSQRNEVSRSATDLSSRPQTSDAPRHDRVRLLSDSRRINTEPGQPSSISDVWHNGGSETDLSHIRLNDQTDSRLPAPQAKRAVPVPDGSSDEPSRRPPPTPCEPPMRPAPGYVTAAAPVAPHALPRQSALLPTRTRTQYTEPSIACARCSRPNIQYELHQHCSRCVMDLCLPCYRAARGCNHWFGFGKAAQVKFEASHPYGRGSQLIELPHILVGRRYLAPPSQSVKDDATQTAAGNGAVITTSDPTTRLQEGKFCDRCQSFANACFWSCDYCNEGEWGFCNKCVNTHHCCTHPLLPMSHKSFAPKSSKSARGRSYDPSTGSITLTPSELHARIVPATPHDRPLTPEPTTSDGAITEPGYLQLTFTTNCDICTDPISPSESRFHCPEHPSPSRHDPENKGDYDICISCYFYIVKLGKIKREDGPAGWRKCPSGHRMIVVEFDDEFPQLDGHRRIVINDLIGGHKFTAEDIVVFTASLSSPTTAAPTMIPTAAGRWSWRENSEGKRSSRLRAVPLNAQASNVPPDGGFGKRCLGMWSYYPEQGDGGKGELLFPKGAEVREVEDINEEWYFGVYAGEKGLFPAQYVRVLDG
jgi:hypothetical protein